MSDVLGKCMCRAVNASQTVENPLVRGWQAAAGCPIFGARHSMLRGRIVGSGLLLFNDGPLGFDHPNL